MRRANINDSSDISKADSSWPPHVTVATVVKRDDKYLIVEERDGELTVFNQPAGHLEPNETLFEAALRETLEETAWEVELTGFVGLYQYYSAHNDTTYMRICFYAEAQKALNTPLDDGILAAHWLSLDDLQSRALRSPLVLQCIQDAEQNTVMPLNVVKHIL